MPEKLIYRRIDLEEEDSCNGVSFVVAKYMTHLFVLYAYCDTAPQKRIGIHEKIFQLAISDNRIPEEATALSGGVFNYQTGEFNPSNSFNEPEELLKDEILDRFDTHKYRRHC